jgi:hypothetical protein
MLERFLMLMDWWNQYCKNSYFAKAIYIFDAITIKIPMTFATEIKQSTINFLWKHKSPQIVKAILSKKSNAECITITDFKLHYRTLAIKTAGTGTKDMKTNEKE